MSQLNAKVAVVTGASSGIGAALSREFARRGARVVLLARRKDRIDAVAAEITAAGGRALAIPCDVTNDGDVEKAFARVRKEMGTIDIVVANAGFGVVGMLETLDLDAYRRQMEVNVFGVLRTVFATVEELRRTRGRLAIIGSVAGYLPVPGGTPYSMSKFAVRALARGLAHELAPGGVSVTHVAPGFVESEIYQVDNHGVRNPAAASPVPPWLRIDTARAARRIAGAVIGRRRELVLTGHGKAAVFLYRHFPWLVDAVLARSAIKLHAGSPAAATESEESP
jgi:short-subunit dehydrogenase